jgi:hypothetical protein
MILGRDKFRKRYRIILREKFSAEMFVRTCDLGQSASRLEQGTFSCVFSPSYYIIVLNVYGKEINMRQESVITGSIIAKNNHLTYATKLVNIMQRSERYSV